MHQLEFTQDVKGETFTALISYSCERSETIGFVLRKDHDMSDRTEKFMGAIKSEIVRDDRTDRWPGTVLVGSRARVVECRSTTLVANSIAEVWDGFFYKPGTDFPEDLFMIHSRGIVILETIGHEQFAVVSVNRIEMIVKDVLDQRKLTLVEERQ